MYSRLWLVAYGFMSRTNVGLSVSSEKEISGLVCMLESNNFRLMK